MQQQQKRAYEAIRTAYRLSDLKGAEYPPAETPLSTGSLVQREMSLKGGGESNEK